MPKKNLAIFASYDCQNIVHEYVLTCLRELSKVADVIFVSDNALSQKEQEKLIPYTIERLCYHHGMYDFGSYKLGYLQAYENNLLYNYEGLIFCNDSVFGPFYPLDEVIGQIKLHPCDFGGCMKHFQKDGQNAHIQSYFIYFKKNVFTSTVFHDFVMKISKLKNKQDIIMCYEVGLSVYLENNGFKSHGMFEASLNLPYSNKALEIIEKGFPFLKKSLFDYRYFLQDGYCRKISDYKKVLAKVSPEYDSSQIEKYNNQKFKKWWWRLYVLGLKYYLIFHIVDFFFKKKVTKKGKLLIKICKIPVFSKTIVNK